MCIPLYNSGRILNIDNYYTSPILLAQLKSKGLYARGTVRSTRKHVPSVIRFTPDEIKNPTRGMSHVAVQTEYRMLAAAWYDGNEVLILSNADKTGFTTVTRRVLGDKMEIQTPWSIKRYNKKMQGVDRFDQSLERFSMASHSSFQKWYKNWDYE